MCVSDTGGETIRDICRQSGAHVELNRDQNASSLERVFRISGQPDQMQHAMRLISEKAGIVSHSLTLYTGPRGYQKVLNDDRWCI